jgi:hypothetical protein
VEMFINLFRSFHIFLIKWEIGFLIKFFLIKFNSLKLIMLTKKLYKNYIKKSLILINLLISTISKLKIIIENIINMKIIVKNYKNI